MSVYDKQYNFLLIKYDSIHKESFQLWIAKTATKNIAFLV